MLRWPIDLVGGIGQKKPREKLGVQLKGLAILATRLLLTHGIRSFSLLDKLGRIIRKSMGVEVRWCMTKAYRNVDERRQIIRSMIADTNPPELATFDLSPSEEVYFRARSAKIVEKLAKQSASFKEYYALPAQKPFGYIVAITTLVIFACVGGGLYIYIHTSDSPAYPVYAALMSISAVAATWSIAGWITHRNTIRQNTNSIIFVRFSQAPFGEALHRFHTRFDAPGSGRVTTEILNGLRSTGNEEDRRSVASVIYLLNYFEFIASGVLRGDLDQEIIRKNLRGLVCFYFDKCEPYIRQSNKLNPLVFEHLIKLRTHYREP